MTMVRHARKAYRLAQLQWNAVRARTIASIRRRISSISRLPCSSSRRFSSAVIVNPILRPWACQQDWTRGSPRSWMHAGKLDRSYGVGDAYRQSRTRCPRDRGDTAQKVSRHATADAPALHPKGAPGTECTVPNNTLRVGPRPSLSTGCGIGVGSQRSISMLGRRLTRTCRRARPPLHRSRGS